MWAMDRLLLCCLHTFPPEADTSLNVTLLKCLKRTEEWAKIQHRRAQAAAGLRAEHGLLSFLIQTTELKQKYFISTTNEIFY